MSDVITAYLRVANVAAEALAKFSPLMTDFPELEEVVDHCAYLMNETLDYVADELISIFPDTPRDKRTNGQRLNSYTCSFAPMLPPGASGRGEEDGGYLDPSDESETAWEPATEREVSRCKALLLEVLRRAAHDWVLYRQHKKMDKRELAHDAYIWLFEENEGHPYRRERLRAVFPGHNGRPIGPGARLLTSFQSVCETLDLDPETVRGHIKKMDARSIIASGRPPQQRYPSRDPEEVVECAIQPELLPDEGTGGENYISQYESIGAVPTPTVVYRGLREPREVPSPEGDF